MKQILDIPYGSDTAEPRRVDVFLPENNGNGRCVFFVHGGGWRGGKRQAWAAVMQHFCERGYVCASAGYRLAPETQFPLPVEDVRQAMAFVRSKADEYEFDPERMAVWGSSAGAHLAAMLATVQPEDNLGMTPETVTRNTLPNAAVCLCAVLSCHFYTDRPGIADMIRSFLGTDETEDLDVVRQASPVDRVCGKEPPFLMIVGDNDPTTPVELHEQMRDELTAKGVPAELVVLPGVEHGFGYGVTTDAQQTTCRLAREFLDRVL